MKRKIQDLTNKERMETLDALYTAAATLKGRSAVKLFLRDLLTVSERIMLGRRILIARMLIAGETYDAIGRKLRVGEATIHRIQRWLDDQFPGFENAIAEMNTELEKRKKKAEYPASYSYAWFKKKYPLHFLLFPEAKKKQKR